MEQTQSNSIANSSPLHAFELFVNSLTYDKDNDNPNGKYYAVMFFENEYNLGISDDYDKWINLGNRYTRNAHEALHIYANTPNPASQLIEATSIQELADKMNQRIRDFSNPKFLKELYETL